MFPELSPIFVNLSSFLNPCVLGPWVASDRTRALKSVAGSRMTEREREERQRGEESLLR